MRLYAETWSAFKPRLRRIHPASALLFSYVATILVGTFLLMLPVATVSGKISFINALFTATSSVCVTGLVVVDTGSYYTIFGQAVILVLIQAGGIGVMTISVAIFRLIGHSISFRNRMVLQDVFSHSPRQDFFSLMKSIFIFTLAIELVGGLLLFGLWHQDFSWTKAVWISLFHSVSAFCNAGFSLFNNSLMGYSHSWIVNSTIGFLIIFGGLGFPVFYDLYSCYFSNNHRNKLAVQTKTVLLTTVSLVVAGAAVFLLLENHHALGGAPLSEKIFISLFQSITCRTAGFNSIDMTLLSDPTLVFMIALMFFGASPGSCGGGVKTTTLALICAFTWSRFRRKRRVNLFNKSIPMDTVNKSITLTLTSIGIICFFFFLILVHGEGTLAAVERSFLAFGFETVSAFGTVGLSMGVTSTLNCWGKSWIILLMLIGRVGVLTMSYIIIGQGKENGLEYAEENIMIG